MTKRILLVEDDEDSLLLMSDILEILMGQDVVVAKDGIEAIRMAQAHQPDLILMDLNLPMLDGWQATRSLKDHEMFRNVPILALTANAMVGDRERTLEAGFDDYFPKPIDVDAFIAFLQPYLNSKGVAG